MKSILAKYSQFVRQPDVARLLAVALVTRMPVGMVGFSMLMFLRQSLGNFALAGTAVGANFIAIAVTAPILGRIIDRHGPGRVLWVTGTVQPLALLAILAGVKLGLPFGFVVASAACAGAFATPITTLTRAVWRQRFEREEDRRTAFALDAVTIEVNFTAGPAIMAGILAIAGATAAFGVAIAATFVAILVFTTSPALRYFRRETGVRRHMLGPLTEPRLWVVFAATFGLTVAFGFLEVGYPAYATALGFPAVGGLLLGVNSLGSAVGGALYGGLHFKSPVERQFSAAMGLMVVPLLLHTFVSPTPLFAVVAFLAGALIAPSIAAQSTLVSRLAPSHYAAEAFTWSSTFIVSGLGAGMALGGQIVEHAGVRVPFAIGAAIVACTAALALSLSPSRRAMPAPQAQD
ncbi:MAG TPA: MFS transporter [Usitatibacter sp.]|nr:MFS transporter [Usitatibacter sp.]